MFSLRNKKYNNLVSLSSWPCKCTFMIDMGAVIYKHLKNIYAARFEAKLRKIGVCSFIKAFLGKISYPATMSPKLQIDSALYCVTLIHAEIGQLFQGRACTNTIWSNFEKTK